MKNYSLLEAATMAGVIQQKFKRTVVEGERGGEEAESACSEFCQFLERGDCGQQKWALGPKRGIV